MEKDEAKKIARRILERAHAVHGVNSEKFNTLLDDAKALAGFVQGLKQ